MKPLMKQLLFIPVILLLTGCWDRNELNDLSLITAIAFDRAENGEIKTTVQILIPQSQGGGLMQGGSSGQRTTIRSSEGTNIADALAKLQRKIPRKLFWGQCKIFIFSEAYAKSGIRDDFDFLVRHPQPRERAYMLISKGEASEALELFPPIERSSAEVLRELTNLQRGIRVTMEQLSIMLKGKSQTAALPLVHILPPPKSADKPFMTLPYMKGAAVLKQGKLVGEISEEVMRGIMWVNNDIKDITITYKAGATADHISLNPVKAHIKLIPTIKDDKWMITIKVTAEAGIIQNGTPMNPMNPHLLKIMNEAFRKDVKERIQLAVRDAQVRLKTDFLNFATAFYRKYPEQWEKVKSRWDEQFTKVEVKIDVKTQLIKPGLVNSPGGLPLEEVKQK